MSNINDMASFFLTVRANPTAMIRLVLANLERVTNGEVLMVDASNPVAHAIDTMCSVGSAVMLNAESQTRRLYPSAAASYEDLYFHMTDRDYLDLFAKPSTTTMQLILPVDELTTKAVEIPNSGGIRKITIPKHTEIFVSGVYFTMQYAIDIRVMPHGGFSVLLDTSEQSPLYAVDSNQLQWGNIKNNDDLFMVIEVPVYQMRIVSYSASLTATSGFSREYNFDDSFYYCRAFVRSENGATWNEIRVSHNPLVYDPNVPTAILKVLNKKISVTIPNVYFRAGLIQDIVRIDIYTTRGAFETRLSGISPESFSRKWRDLDRNTDTIYSAPLSTFTNSVSFFSSYAVSGGSPGITFQQLRERIIQRSTTQRIPITELQLINTVNDMGYSIVKDIDNITARHFLATKAIPAPTDSSTATSIGCAVQTLQFNGLLVDPRIGIIDNGNRITLTPKTLFENVNGVLKTVPAGEFLPLTDGSTFTPDQISSIVNAREFLYTPFYYVMDISASEISTRPYRLDRPRIVSKREFQVNAPAMVEAFASGYGAGLEPNGNGFLFEVDLSGNETLLQFPGNRINLQMSYLPSTGGNRIYINGTLISQLNVDGIPLDGIYRYRFLIETSFDINRQHQIIHKPFGTGIDLVTEFDLVAVVSDYMPAGVGLSDIDSIVDPTGFSNYSPTSVYLGLVQEKMTVKFGDYLEHLWSKNRTIVEATEYKRYVEDIPATYAENIYQRDSLGNLVFTDNDAQGFGLVLKHRVGDPVLTEVGLTVFAHRKGDVMLDVDGHPIPIDGVRSIGRLVDLVLLDARYYFATEKASVDYRKNSVQTVTDWLTTDIPRIAKMTYERTRVSFHPKTSVGSISVIDENGSVHAERAEQFLSVLVYVEESIRANPDIQEIITTKIKSTLVESLKNPISSTSNLIDDLRDALGSDVKTIVVNGLFGDRYNVVRLQDASLQPTIGKRLQVLSNLTMQVVDALNIEYRTIR